MVPKKNKKSSKKHNKVQLDTTRSVLNVNASEFIPSTNAAQNQDFSNSVPSSSSSVDQVQYSNSGGGDGVMTVDDSATTQRQENAHSFFLSGDQLQDFSMGRCEGINEAALEQRREFTQSAFSAVNPMQSLNNFETSVNMAARPPGLEYPYPVFSLVAHLQNVNIDDGSGDNIHNSAFSQRPQFAHSLYSTIGHTHFENSLCEPIEDLFPQRQEYSHSTGSAVENMQNFNFGGFETKLDDVTRPIYTSDYSLVNYDMQNLDIIQCEANDGAASLQSQKYSHSAYATNYNMGSCEADSIISLSEPKIFLNQEQQYKDASDTAFSSGDDWDGHESTSIAADYTGIDTSITASCLPEDNNLIGNTNHSSDISKEIAVEASCMPENDIINQGTIDQVLNEDNNNEVKINDDENISVEPAGVPKDNNPTEEEVPQPTTQKSSKKKNRSRIHEVCSDKEHVNIVFIGHVDAGKSTIGGQLMYLTGMVDKRTMDKYEKEAKEKSRDSWYLSWALDTDQEERDRGKTVETGRGYFETKTKHFTILDAPGHKIFVPSMICGTAQADIAVLVLSARQNEFESGFDKGGQTRDHVMLAKSAGLNFLIALVNKMDDSTVKWDETRYNYCRDKTIPFLKKIGYTNKDVYFMPVSGQTGDGLKDPLSKSICPWFKGPSFIDYLDKMSSIARLYERPFVMPIVDKYKDMGTVVMGKVEAGCTHISNCHILMPNKVTISVEQIWSDDKEVTSVKAGENVKIRLKGIEEEEISPGFVLCDINKPITTATLFDAQLHILNCKSIITRGYSAVMHTQSVAEMVTITQIICLVDPKTNVKIRKKLHFVKKDDNAIMRIQCSGVICLTVFKEFSQLGRFTLREDNKVVAIGVVLKIIM